MAHAYDRHMRVADLIKNEIAKLLQAESKDPRFLFVSVTSVEVSRDYSTAKVYVTVLHDEKVKESLSALNKAAGFFRYQLAHQTNLRTTPKLQFVYDETLKQGQKISELLRKSQKEAGE